MNARINAQTVMNWDLASYFPRFGGPEMNEFKSALQGDITSLLEKATVLPSLGSENAAAWESAR